MHGSQLSLCHTEPARRKNNSKAHRRGLWMPEMILYGGWRKQHYEALNKWGPSIVGPQPMREENTDLISTLLDPASCGWTPGCSWSTWPCPTSWCASLSPSRPTPPSLVTSLTPHNQSTSLMKSNQNQIGNHVYSVELQSSSLMLFKNKTVSMHWNMK